MDSAGRTASAIAASATGQAPPPEVPTATQRDYAVVHYNRPDGDYDDWRLYAWGDLADGEATPWPEGHAFTGRDAYGAFAYVRLKPGASSVSYLVIDKNGTKDVAADRSIDVTKTGEIWLEQGKEPARTERPAHPPQDQGKAVLHHQRPDGAYDGWGLHVWTGAATPTDWSKPLLPARFDSFGAVYEVPLAPGATSLSYILHKGDEKDLPSDQSLDLKATGHEVWTLGGREKYLLPQPAGSAAALDLTKAEAVWIDRDTVAWNAPAAAASVQLLASREGAVKAANGTLTGAAPWLRLHRTELTAAQKQKFPHLAAYAAFTVDPRDRDRVREALRGQLVASARAANGAVLAATGVQLAGVLDDLYATTAALGPVFKDGRPTLSVWAPTAQQVALELDGRTVAMRRDDATGVWSVRGERSWAGKPYRYAVTVWAPSTRQVVRNLVTDPTPPPSPRTPCTAWSSTWPTRSWRRPAGSRCASPRPSPSPPRRSRSCTSATSPSRTAPAPTPASTWPSPTPVRRACGTCAPSPRPAPRTCTCCPPSTSAPSRRRRPTAPSPPAT